MFKRRYKKLYKAIKERDLERVKAMLESSKIDLEYTVSDYSFLARAVEQDDLPMVELLLSHGADVNGRFFQAYGFTPLMFVQSTEVLDVLMTAGADVNASDRDGWTPIRQAIFNAPECVQPLIKYKADIFVQVGLGNTLLHSAVESGRVEIVQMLIDKGIDINTANSKGDTALHLATSQEKDEIICLLLDTQGINLNIPNQKGKRPIDIARSSGKGHISKLFEDKSAVAKEIGFHRVSDQIVTQVLGTCPVNGILTETFNFQGQKITASSDRAAEPSISFTDYASVTRNGRQNIEAAYAWLSEHSEADVPPPFTEEKPTPLKKVSATKEKLLVD